jgi:hypothetical protein
VEVSITRPLALAVAVLLTVTLLAAGVVVPARAAGHPTRLLTADEQRWVTAARAFARDVEERVDLAAAGGSDLASARRALHDTSRLYATLVAYTYFASCSTILRKLGSPSPRLLAIAQPLARACRGFEHASALYAIAVQQNDPSALVAASQASLGAFCRSRRRERRSSVSGSGPSLRSTLSEMAANARSMRGASCEAGCQSCGRRFSDPQSAPLCPACAEHLRYARRRAQVRPPVFERGEWPEQDELLARVDAMLRLEEA